MNWPAAALAALLVLGFLAALESGLRALVRSLRRDCQWLITEADETPAFEPQALRKFLAGSFDPELGWVRKPNSEGVEKGARGEIVFRIDERGARVDGGSHDRPPLAAAFGDSYVFGRQVEDGETWAAELGRLLGGEVANFGVGNYGADQGLLRYERTPLPEGMRWAILGFVPETICRVQSYWKHYLEFGNTFAFKPRFELDAAGALTLVPSAMAGAEDFAALADKLDYIRRHDGFYRRKFRALQFRGSYLLSLLRRPGRQFELIAAAWRRRRGAMGPEPFALVVRRNIREAHALYAEEAARQLLRAVLLRFAESARQRGHEPLVVVFPQLFDLKAGEKSTRAYREFFAEVGRDVPLLDLTEALHGDDIDALYVEDAYGGHLSALGNAVAARALAERLAAACAAPDEPGQSAAEPRA